MFQFKQFSIQHDRCAMKVGTDAVLLGSWATISEAKRVLDVGTGSGLVAIMLAQRNRTAHITGVEIDRDAALQAMENVAHCCFAADRVHIVEGCFQEYSVGEKYDLIVSNPPFFSNSLQPSQMQRRLARHDDSLPLELLIQKSASLLTSTGRFALIIPTTEEERLNSAIQQNGLHIQRLLRVKGNPNAAAKRILVEVGASVLDVTEQTLIIEKERHCYTEEYKRLTEEFYLGG